MMRDVIEALRLGAWDFITKPVQDLVILEHTVRKGIERAGLMREKREHRVFLEKEIKRLSRTAHRLIWLNPLAGSEDYQPIVKGIQTVFPHLDDFYPLANLNDLVSLTKALNLNRR